MLRRFIGKGFILFAAALAAFFVAACGGGGGGGVSSGAATTLAYDEVKWNIRAINADWAHRSTCSDTLPNCVAGSTLRGGGVMVAVVDDGIDLDNPDLAENITLPTLGSPRYDEDNDEFTYDAGYLGEDDHGTHVAGIIAARLNGEGVAGVAPEASILPLRFLGGGYNLAELYNYAISNTAFVANNSWGWDFGSHQIQVEERFPSLTINYWMDYPRGDLNEYTLSNREMFTRAVNSGMLIVFANGNDWWNTETPHPTCRDTDFPVTDNLCIASVATMTVTMTMATITMDMTVSVTTTLTTRTTVTQSFTNKYLTSTMTMNIVATAPAQGGTSNSTNITATIFGNLPGVPPLAVLQHPELTSSWLNVVAINSLNSIAPFSNGCGQTRDFCLAAPGTHITSAVLDGEIRAAHGTSQAAPHVSGAAALLKGAFPNLSAHNVQRILLESATDLGAAGVDDVYGHGMLNVSAAFDPAGPLRAASSTSAQRFSIADSRINLSPVFGKGALKNTRLQIGALDKFGRVYATAVDFGGGVYITKPNGAQTGGIVGGALHAAYAAPLSHQKRGRLFSAMDSLSQQRHRRGDESGLIFSAQQRGDFVSQSAQWDGFAWDVQRGDATHRAGDERAADFWRAPFVDSSAAQHRVSYSQKDGGIMFSAGKHFRQTAARRSFTDSLWRINAEGGFVSENGKALGADFGGAFQIRDSQTAYHRLSGIYHLSAAILFADYVRAQTSARGGGIIQSLNTRADSFSAGISAKGWRAELAMPFMLSTGAMKLRYINGYDKEGNYAHGTANLDLGVKRRERVFRLLREDSRGGMKYALGFAYAQNAAARDGAGDDVSLSAAARFEF